MRRLALGSLVTISCVLWASPALAAKPAIVRFPVDVTFRDHSCGFAVRVQVTGVVVEIQRTDARGNLVDFQAYPTETQTLTNLGTGTTITTNLSGPQHATIHPDGSSTLVGTGTWSWGANPRTGDPGIFLTEGRFVLVTDARGNRSVTSLVGHVVALCPALAG
jgi:hypothetical protein